MPYALKPKFEQYRATLLKRSSPLREKDVVPLQASISDAVGQMPDLLIEKVRRLPKPEGMVEITAKYFGLGADQAELIVILKREFPEESLGLDSSTFWVGPSEDAVLLMFAGMKGDRFLTGRVLIGLS